MKLRGDCTRPSATRRRVSLAAPSTPSASVFSAQHGERIGVPRGFGIADDAYQVQLLRRLGVPKDEYARSRLNDFSRHRMAEEELHPNSIELLRAYRAALAKRKLLDYDDLVLRAAELLAIPEVREAIAARWDCILVDESQDLNPGQYAVINHLAQGHRHLFAVGDDEQSIFSWTGADPRVLQQLMNDYDIRQPIVLVENRRSARSIFERARRLLKRNPVLFKKELRSTRESPFEVEVRLFPDDESETAWLLEDIRRDRTASGLPWGEYGVLYRTHDIGSRIEGMLLQAGVPCRLASGRALQDDPVVRYLVAALRVCAMPGDPVPEEALAKVVLPDMLYQRLRAETAREDRDLLDWLRVSARRGNSEDPEVRKLRRFLFLLDNLNGLARRHATAAGSRE